MSGHGLLYRGRKSDRRELRAVEEERRLLVSRIEDCRQRVHMVSDDVRKLRAELDEARRRADELERRSRTSGPNWSCCVTNSSDCTRPGSRTRPITGTTPTACTGTCRSCTPNARRYANAASTGPRCGDGSRNDCGGSVNTVTSCAARTKRGGGRPNRWSSAPWTPSGPPGADSTRC